MTPQLQSLVFRALVVGLLSLIAWVSSDLILLRVEASLGESTARRGPEAQAPLEEVTGETDPSAITRRNLFNSAAPAEGPASTAPQLVEAEPNEPVAPTTLSLALVGVWMGDATQQRGAVSWAIIEDLTAKTQDSYRVGDALPGGEAEIVGIQPRSVTIRRNGQLEAIGFPVLVTPGASGATTSASAPPRGASGEEVRQIAQNRYEIGQRYLDHTLSNLTSVLSQARAIPLENGQGFRLRSIKKDSIFEKVGLQNGDVLRSVNGIELSSVEAGMKAFKLLQKETRLWIDVRRNDAPLRLDYEIR